MSAWIDLAEDLFLFRDTCNVYLLRQGKVGIAVDFGTGAFVQHLPRIGIERLEHVVLTHAHRDQCCGLYRRPGTRAQVHAPAGDARLLRGADLQSFWQTYQAGGCPASYAAPLRSVEGICFDLAADGERRIGPALFCAVATPGHTPGALSYLVEWRGRHLCFCGDAVHQGGHLHQPYHLEWDHWTPAGALAAWCGLERLGYCHFDQLLPAHGPPLLERPGRVLGDVQRKLMRLVRAKGSVCAGEKNRWWEVEGLECGARRVLPHLYHFGANSFLLLSERGEGLVVDPQQADLDALDPLLGELGVEKVSAATATHYHRDHADGLDLLRQRHGTPVWLHPWVAAPLRERDAKDLPWLPARSIGADRLLPEEGSFRWCEYRFGIRPFPGQTWWHCAFDARVDGRHVLFSGDNFQPPSRWNGTGGFCAFNGSRFGDGFARSAQTALEIDPDLVCNGHGCIYRFSRGHYRRILRWAAGAERAVRALCTQEAWLAEYDPRALRWQPFRQDARPGERLELRLVHHNHGEREVQLGATPVLPEGWTCSPRRRRARVPAGKSRALTFAVRVPRRAVRGRHLLAADCEVDGEVRAEACVALVDIA